MKVEFRCPKCNAPPDNHGKAISRPMCTGSSVCSGFLCECPWDTLDSHGESYEDPCLNANCGHCGWGGKFPRPPKKAAPWEKQALAAGWTPPAKRAKELKT